MHTFDSRCPQVLCWWYIQPILGSGSVDLVAGDSFPPGVYLLLRALVG